MYYYYYYYLRVIRLYCICKIVPLAYLVVETWARGQCDIKYRVPRASVFYMSYCPSVHVLTSIAFVANTLYTVADALYIIKIALYRTFSMVTDVIYTY